MLQDPQDPAVVDNFQSLVALQLVAVVAGDEEELEDPAPLPLGPTVEEQDPAALPEGPEPPELHVLRPHRCHLFRVLCILKILSTQREPVLRHQVLLLAM